MASALLGNLGRALVSRGALGAAGVGVGLVALKGTVTVAHAHQEGGGAAEQEKVGLSPKEFRPFPLLHKEQITANTALYRFGLADQDTTLGLTVASLLMTKATVGEEAVVRPYTPTTSPSTKGYFDLIIKTYPTGKMGNHFSGLKVGDTVDMKGPFVKIDYKPNYKKKIGMIAGGTGITPMYQVLTEILANEADMTEVSLLYGNITEKDIILKGELDKLAASHSNFKLTYILDKPPAGWAGAAGYVTADLVTKHMPPPAADNLVLVCGPPPMMVAISGNKNPDKSQGDVTGILAGLGYDSSNVYKF